MTIAQHMGGLPELALVLGPLLLIAVFVKLARRAEAAEAESGKPPDDAEDEPR